MAQVKKDDVKDSILEAAQREFLSKGFSDTSMREIARSAELTKGAIYTYFPNKEALFDELIAPAVRYIETLLSPCAKRCDLCQNAPFSTYEKTVQSFRNCAEVVLAHHEAFRLLLMCAKGSFYRDFKERIIHMYSRCMHQLFTNLIDAPEIQSLQFSDMFTHTLANLFVTYLEEIVLHEPNREEVMHYAEEMATFIHGGCNGIYQSGRS